MTDDGYEDVKTELIDTLADDHGVPHDVSRDYLDEWAAVGGEGEMLMEQVVAGAPIDEVRDRFVEHLMDSGVLIDAGDELHPQDDGFIDYDDNDDDDLTRLDTAAASYDAAVDPYEEELFNSASPLAVSDTVGSKTYSLSDDDDDENEYDERGQLVVGDDVLPALDADIDFLRRYDNQRKPLPSSSARKSAAPVTRADMGGPFGRMGRPMTMRETKRQGRPMVAHYASRDRQGRHGERRKNVLADRWEYDRPGYRRVAGAAPIGDRARGAEQKPGRKYYHPSAGKWAESDIDALLKEADAISSKVDANILGQHDLEPIGLPPGRYFQAKGLVDLVRRLRQRQESAVYQGQRIGVMLAQLIDLRDKKGRERKEFPETPSQQTARRNAVATVATRLALCAVDAADPSGAKRDLLKAQIRSLLEKVSANTPGAAAISAPLNVGVHRQVRRTYRGAIKKVRSVLNRAERRLIKGLFMDFATKAMLSPGAETGPTRKGVMFDAALNEFADVLKERLRKNEGAARSAAGLFYGILETYITYEPFRAGGKDLAIATAVESELEYTRPQMAFLSGPTGAKVQDADSGDGTSTLNKMALSAPSGESVVSDESKAMADALVKHGEFFLKRNPTQAGRAKGDLLLLVPENREALKQVAQRLRDGGIESKDEYIKNALLAQHPHSDMEKGGHVLALSGKVFHVAQSSAQSQAFGQSLVVSQMRRVGAQVAGGLVSKHDDAWDAEARNAGGAVTRVADIPVMHCRIGERRTMDIGEKGLSIQPLYYDITSVNGV